MNQEQEVQDLKQQIAKYEAMNSNYDDEVDLKVLFSVIWSGKWKVIVITFVFAIFSVIYALSLPNIYRSESLLIPNNQDQGTSGLAGMAGQLGGLASIAGINLSGDSTDQSVIALEVLKSREFIYKFINDNDLKATLIGVKGWEESKNTLIYNLDIYDPISNIWFKESEPTLFDVYKHFIKDVLSVTKDKENGMVRVAISHYSPYLAKELVEKIILALNQTIKKQDLEEANRSIEYLTNELMETKLTGMQAMFYTLIEQQQQTLMLTKIRDDYALKVIDPPIVPEKKEKPLRALIVVGGAMLGGMLALFGVLIRYFVNKD